ncbi:hypothetical protein LT679_15050 [Mucilaginibacter roseus]|uniref:Uncharacterized protein n=1 Tax=Mucilaginibacter roseus TaxID=1528868 RepID=A0ABS8U889_9SPHI|nr:hypothetical protein [Mucilaginibacter roseus]MCD8741931.1 hypothetical protein [Mucilaginibacter roseus]
MRAALIYSKLYLRIAAGLLFVLLIGFKVTAPVFIASASADKELASNADDDSDKKSENNSSPEKEFIRPLYYTASSTLFNNYIEHCTIYKGNYKATYYQKIAIPPPDGISINS